MKSKSISLRFIPAGPDKFDVRATNRNERFPYTDNPIGIVAKNPDGTWSHSNGASPHLGPIFGNARTRNLAGMACYRSHRSWVGY